MYVLQVAHTDFFLRTLPLFDAGDDVGMVLSPQYFHNVDFDADIFNHSNIQFWEYAQHGYDAIGFNSCTGILIWNPWDQSPILRQQWKSTVKSMDTNPPANSKM